MRLGNVNNQCSIHSFCTSVLLVTKGTSEKQNHEFHDELPSEFKKTSEMQLVAHDKTQTFGLCSIYLLCNVVTIRSVGLEDNKDLVLISNEKDFEKHYRFEDFFWTGSDNDFEKESSFYNESNINIGLIEASPFETWKTTTVFHTTTILFATVFPNSDSCNESVQGCTPQVSPIQTRSIEFSLPTVIPDGSAVVPCPTHKVLVTETFDFYNIFTNENEWNVTSETSPIPVTLRTSTSKSIKTDIINDIFEPETDPNFTSTTVFPDFLLDKKYWIMTVLRNDNFSENLNFNLTEKKLSTLFKKAFNRRQESFFGENDHSIRRDRKLSQQVKVNILNVTRAGNNLKIIYYVNVAGKPVPAMTAANDMRLITANEVIAELGYPILSKAEPYIKSIVSLGARVKGRARDTWLLIGSIIAAVLLLLILASLIALILSKREIRSKDVEKTRQVFEQKETGKGHKNLAFENDNDSSSRNNGGSSKKDQTVHKDWPALNLSATSHKCSFNERNDSATSSTCSNSSEASLVRLRYQKRLKEKEIKPKAKPRTRMRKIENSNACKSYEERKFDRHESAITQRNYNEITTEEHENTHYSPHVTRSPTSYLSMPSVRAFPSGTQIPEPLNKILEPISIRHFDADSDSPMEYPQVSTHKVDIEHVCEIKHKSLNKKSLTRHASLEGNDPGFIGPVVWNRHVRKIGEKEIVALDRITSQEVDENINIGRMRKRFNELLDDALSMFGSRNPSPEETIEESGIQPDKRVHSAVVRPASIFIENTIKSRPKTTGTKRPQSAVITGPRGAWDTPSCSTLIQSDVAAAAVFQKVSPTINRKLISVNSELGPTDSAVPLIAAIKNELKKFEEHSCNKH